MKTQAWVTSAVDDASAEKAIILAGSLRRVCTGKSLAVITSFGVSEKLRKKLRIVFDLVHLMSTNSSNGLVSEENAKVEALSLLTYEKYVYLTPNSLVLRNCDEIFKKYGNFAVAQTDTDWDTSMFLFTPSLELADKFATKENGKEVFFKTLGAFLQNNATKIEKIDDDYMRLSLEASEIQSSILRGSIAIFSNVHPLDYSNGLRKELQFEALNKFCIDYARKIYLEDGINASIDVDQSLIRNRYKSEPIAVVGMSFRLPGANSPDELWSLLEKGQSAIVQVPDHRWKKEHSYYPCTNREVEAGFLNFPVDEFDAKFFGLSPKEAEFLDPQQRLLLEVTWEALEEANIDPLKIRGTNTGIFVGSWINDYKEMVRSSVDFNSFRSYMGNSVATTSARLSHFFETTGPSIGLESGCSSAFAAVDMACKSLRNGTSDIGIAAGTNLLLHAFEVDSMEFIFSPDCRCKTFDADANGFARAEGCAVLILKRLSDAVRDEDDIWGLVRGTALTQEGTSKSFGTPTIQCESLAMELALKDAGVHPKDVSYIEAHGTGTAVGDPMEIKAIERVYSSEERPMPLVIGSVKTNLGHTESVSGITGLIKVLLSMKHELIPKHLNLKTLNPNINLEAIPAAIPLNPVAWPKSLGKPRLAGVSSFGISGTDGHAIVEEPPLIPKNQIEHGLQRPLHIMKISAKSAEALDELLRKYLQICEQNEDNGEGFANLAYSANVGRTTFNHRAVLVAKNFAHAAKILKEKEFKQADIKFQGSRLCFLFTGQGSQYPNMAKQLYKTSPIFKDGFDKCDNVLQRRYNISIKDVVWPKDAANENNKLSRTLYSQTSIFVVEYCLLKLWESWGVKPDYVLGHSLGEFAAAVATGSLNLEDALMLVAERSRLIDSLPRGKMLVIKADKRTVDKMISKYQENNPEFWVDYAAINSPEQTVVAGDCKFIEEFSKFLATKSLKSVVLASTHAFHSRHMEPMLDEYGNVAKAVKQAITCNDRPKYISGMEGKLIELDEINADYWVRHTREKVSFMDACKVAQEEGCNLFVEVGPHPVLSALAIMNTDGNQITCLPSISKRQEEWATLLDTLSKLYLSEWNGEIDWNGFDRFYNKQKVKLPFHPFNRKPIWTKMESLHAKIHPLVGTIVPTATGGTFYQNLITLENTNFVKDHSIGSTVVFPGAGFLEMCLAGGYAAVQGFTETIVKPRRPIFLKSLKILKPLAIHESSVCRLQTVISLVDNKNSDSEIGYSVEVYRQAEMGDGTENWSLHASAKFLPTAPVLPAKLTWSHDINQMQSTCEVSDNKDMYDRLPEVGLRFGPKFQSLERVWKNENAVLASIKVPEDYHDYLIHPVVADALVQAFILLPSNSHLKKKLHVPLQINEFLWLREPEATNLFVFCSVNEQNEIYSKLVDETGTTLALMTGVEFVETNVKLVESIITQQHTAMPKLWQDVWRPTRGPHQGYMTHNTPPEEQCFSEQDLQYFEEKNKLSEDELKFYKNLVNITRLAILKALFELGWKPDLSQSFSVNDLKQTLKIKENFVEYIRFYLRAMASKDRGLLEVMDFEENTFRFVKTPPTNEEIQMGIEYITDSADLTHEEYRLIRVVEKNLDKIFVGQVDPLAILFPNDPTKPSAGKYYEGAITKLTIRPMLAKAGMHIKNSVKEHIQNQFKPTYRILEVGAGTGVITKKFLPELIAENGDACDYEYFVTDISAAFFPPMEKDMKEHLKHLVFKKYDMDKDPLEQGFCPGYFDLITATEVLHIAKDIKKTMKRVRSLLKPGGLLLFEETICPDERNTFSFGLLDGYWHFEDREFRKNHVTLTPSMWKEALTDSGFYGVHVVPLYGNAHGIVSAYAAPTENAYLRGIDPPQKSWIVFGDEDTFTESLCRKLENVNRKVTIISREGLNKIEEVAIREYFRGAIKSATKGNILEGVLYLWSVNPKNKDQTLVSLPFLTLLKLISELEIPPKTYAVIRGAQAIGEYDVIDPTSGTIPGLCKSVSNENVSLNVCSVDLDPNKEVIDQVDELFENLWVDEAIGFAFRDGLKLCPKLKAGKILRNEPLSLPKGCDRFKLVLPKTRLISNLEFAYLDPYELGENDVEIQVKAVALNFRDVFTVLKPISGFEHFNSLGLDYSGVIIRIGSKVTKYNVGDRVTGRNSNFNLSLPSHICDHENLISPLPENMTFAEGSTIPVVLATVVYCLIHLAKIKEGETVLIHTASGGVGLMAIQLCAAVGAKVIATAGSQRKRTYLKNLGIQHVFHSRTTDFKNDILEVTGGRGVDVVLNSLTGPGFKEASLDVLCPSGKFIEMSKLNVWSPEEVQSLRPDVFYKVIDITELSNDERDHLLEEIKKFTASVCIKPIPYERFDALNIRGALNYLQKARHIGKIVCIMPEMKLDNSNVIVTTPLFNEDSTYVITGGLGGIGYEVMKWMLENGAKHIAILSRSTPKPKVADEIRRWNQSGKHVQAFAVDVGNFEDLKNVFDELKYPVSGFPQVRGVMHAAGVLHDGTLENQTWDTFAETYNPKVCGSWNLHELTKDYVLEHFVLFSSIAALFGGPGQTNHSASNAFEDSLAAYRRSNGLVATCVNWGNWGEVGIATEVDFPGVKPISTFQGLLALETFLRTQTNQMCVMNAEAFALLSKLYPLLRHYVDDVRLLGETKKAVAVNSDEFWNEADKATNREDKLFCFKKIVKMVIRNILKIDANEEIDDNTEFEAMGIDSLMMLELKNGIQNVMGSKIVVSGNQLRDSNTTKILANTMVDILEGNDDGPKKTLSPDELRQLIREDSELPAEFPKIENFKPISSVETVLLTGATGNLGPYLLRELTQMTQIKKIYCLVRKKENLSPLERLLARLEKLGIMTELNLDKMEVVEGRLTAKNFGLQDDNYQFLCKNCDAIIHSAVLADHVAKYEKTSKTSDNSLRSVNVFGTSNLLKFAVDGNVKHFFHASSIIAFAGVGKDGKYSEGFQDVTALDRLLDHISWGYMISKHISEQLIYQAIRKGVPCKAFRFPLIAGDSKTGRVDYEKNHAILRWLACMKIGAIHDLPFTFSAMSVDNCAKLSLQVFFNSDAPMDVFNVVPEQVEVEQVLVEVAQRFGIKLDVVSLPKFIELLKQEDQRSPVAPFLELYVEVEADVKSLYENPPIQIFQRDVLGNGKKLMDSSKMRKYAGNYDDLIESSFDVLARDFQYLLDAGVFEKYGIL